MVKLGFIVEGATEKIILEQSDFFAHLRTSGIGYIPEVIDAKGNGNLLPHNIHPLSLILTNKGATHILILTDLDNDQCITNTKARIAPLHNHTVIVSVKVIESWFLSDTSAMRTFLDDPTFAYTDPENVANPFEEIRTIRMSKQGIGVSGKVVLANTMVKKCNFSILNAAKHPSCNSAKYLLNKVAEIAAAK